MRNILMCITFSLGLSACATQPVSFVEAKPVPASSIVKFGDGAARIFIKKDLGYSGACATKVFVDGQLRARVRSGEVVALRSDPGPAIIGVAPDDYCAGALKELGVTLAASSDNRFRILVDQSFVLSIAPTATD